MPKPLALLATFFAIAPKPKIPSVLKHTSTPMAGFHSPFLTRLFAITIFLVTASIRPMARSATAFELVPGTLHTAIPHSFAFSSGMLSRPAPCLQMICRWSHFSITSSGNGCAPITSASYSGMILLNSSWSKSVPLKVISNPASSNTFFGSSLILPKDLDVIKTFLLIFFSF